MGKLLLFLPLLLLRIVTGAPSSLEVVTNFVSHYHRSAAPERVPLMLDLVLDKKILHNPQLESSNGRQIMAHSFGHAARGNPKLIRLYESRFEGADKTAKTFLLEALRICGDEATVKLLDKWAPIPQLADHKKEIDAVRAFIADPKRQLPRDRPAQAPTELDFLWADFLVTGEYAPVSRILDALDQPQNLREKLTKRLKEPFPGPATKKDVLEFLGSLQVLKPGSTETLIAGDLELTMLYDRKGRLKGDGLILSIIANNGLELSDPALDKSIVMNGAAGWSLQANIGQHPRLVEVLKQHYRERPARSQELLKRWLHIDQPKFLLDKETRELQGTWQAITWVVDGDKTDAKTSAETLKYVRWTFDEDGVSSTKAFTVTTDGKVEVRGQGGTNLCTYKIDAAKNPKVMVRTSIDQFWGQSFPCIYKVEDDVLTVCWKNQGKEVPTEFSAAPGTGCTLATLKRIPTAK